MTKKIFITGTDTEVGKTVVSRAIIRAFVNRGHSVVALKPVESGAEKIDGRLIPADATALCKASARNMKVDDICAYAFHEPVSPHLAAAFENRKIEAGPIMELFDRSAADVDLIIAEGAGGLLVPLSFDLLYADLVARSGFSLVIVSPNVLGTINATLLTIEAARARGINVAGVILNRTPPTELGNAEAISRLGKVPILGEFPTIDNDDDDGLARLAEEKIRLELI